MKEDILLLHISVFWPPVELPSHRGVSKGVYRYHYGLEIPEGDVGMTVNGQPFRWQQDRGVIWDDTLLHSAWNKSPAPRLVIFADLPRVLPSPWMNGMNSWIYSLVQRTKHIKEIQARLAQEGITVD
jgi:beta-hydroxylase